MKKLVTLMLLAAIYGLASCGNGGTKITNILTVPVGDSVSKGSDVQITFNNNGTDSESFYITDLTVNNAPIYVLTANTVMNTNDSFWTAKLEIVDFTTKMIALNLTVYRDSSSPIGNYWVSTNNSTMTDYSMGQNRIYQIGPGSVMNIVEAGTLFETGTFNLNLIYNYQITQAYGSFKIFN
jgi:hypothetical protein